MPCACIALWAPTDGAPSPLALDRPAGEIHPRFARRMKAWPHLGTRGEVVLKAVTQVARWTLPSFFCHDNVGEARSAVWGP